MQPRGMLRNFELQQHSHLAIRVHFNHIHAFVLADEVLHLWTKRDGP